MIRSRAKPGLATYQTRQHMRKMRDQIRWLTSLPKDELYVAAKELQALRPRR